MRWIQVLVLVAGVLFVASPAASAAGQNPCEKVKTEDRDVTKRLLDSLGYNGCRIVVSLQEQFKEPESCFPCVMISVALGALTALATAAFNILVIPVAILLPVAFAVWLAVRAGRYLLAWTPDAQRQAMPWTDMVQTGALFLLAAALCGFLGARATIISSGHTNNDAFRVLAVPVAEALRTTAAGAAVLMQALFEGGQDGPYEVGVIFAGGHDAPDAIRSSGIQALEQLHHFVLVFAGAVHSLGSHGISAGAQAWGCTQTASSVGTRVGLVGLGALLVLFFVVFLVTGALRFLDPLIRAFIALGLAPILLACLPFRTTRGLFNVGARSIGYAAVFFLVAGLVFSVLYLVVMEVLQVSSFGVQVPLCDFNKGVLSVNLYDLLVMLIGILLAQAMLGQIGPIAGQIVDYRLQGGVGEQVGQQAMSLGRSSVMLAAYMGMSTATATAKLFKK